LRGIVLHQHGCGEGACRAGRTAAFDLHWQALARRHDCALLGPSYEQLEQESCTLWCDPRNGSEQRFLQALTALAAKSSHPELATVPWALWGHSGGATWAGTMLMLHPQRCAAVWLRSGAPRLQSSESSQQEPLNVPVSAYTVPLMCNLGTREGVTETSGRFAGVWPRVEYGLDGNVRDVTPPPAPTQVRLIGNELAWEAEADLESGIACFITERDGLEIGRVPAKVSGYYVGRPVFQKNGYSDTPAEPLAIMRFCDVTAREGEKHKYRVITVNSVGLRSVRSQTQAFRAATDPRQQALLPWSRSYSNTDLYSRDMNSHGTT